MRDFGEIRMVRCLFYSKLHSIDRLSCIAWRIQPEFYSVYQGINPER